MKYKRFLSVLLSGIMMLSLIACGGTTDTTETNTEDAAFYDAEHGVVVRQWTESFQDYADNLYVDSIILDPGKGDYITADLRYYMEYSDEKDDYVADYFADIHFSRDPSATEEHLLELLKTYGVDDYALESFTTASGQKVWIHRYELDVSFGNPTPEDLANLTAMREGLDEQLAQYEFVAPVINTAADKVSFTTVDLDGNPVDSSVFANAEYTMINVWASFCSPCINEMEELMKMDAEMENVQIITILGDAASVDEETAQTAREIVEKLNLTLPVYLINDEIEAQLSFDAFPTSFMVDRNGNSLGTACVGAVGTEIYQSWIQNCINAQ